MALNNGAGYTDLLLSFSYPILAIPASDERAGLDSINVLDVWLESNNKIGATSRDTQSNTYTQNGIRYYAIGIVN